MQKFTASNAIYLGIGALSGFCLNFYQSAIPEKDDCFVYKVAHKSAVSYALKPPPAIAPDPVVIKETCITKTTENVTQPELTNTDDTQKPVKRRRHHRYRKYWR